MSSSSVQNGVQGLRLISAYGIIFGLALCLSGCIQPLYGPGVGGGSVASEMQAIKVDPIPDRLGHYVENELIFALNGTGSSPAPKYHLVVHLRERLATPTIDTVTGQATSGDVSVDADYQLFPIAGSNNPIAKGDVTNFVVYDRTSQRLSNVRAARDAEIRNAKVLADQIRTRIAAALAAVAENGGHFASRCGPPSREANNGLFHFSGLRIRSGTRQRTEPKAHPFSYRTRRYFTSNCRIIRRRRRCRSFGLGR